MTFKDIKEKDIVYVEHERIKNLILNYVDLLKKNYKASDILERMVERMRSNQLFTATEIAVVLCIAYDEILVPVILREIIKFAPVIFKKLEEMGLRPDIRSGFYQELRDLIKYYRL